MGLNKSKGNMYPWVDFCHTHLGGMCPHQCSYCFVGKGQFGRHPKYKGEPRLLEEELKVNYGSGKIIFIEHMNDMFAKGIKREWIEKILSHCWQYPLNSYIFQTKDPRYAYLFLRLFPEKFMIGTTIETNRDTSLISKSPPPKERYLGLDLFNKAKIFVTCEPCCDFDIETLAGWLIDLKPSFVNIGADSKHCGLPEPPAWKIKELIRRLQEAKVPIKKKINLKRLGF